MTTPDKRLKKALRLHRQKDYVAAARLYRKILKSDPGCASALNFSGLLAHQQGDTEQGIRQISAAINADPNYIDAYLNLGNLLLFIDATQEAFACYNQAHALAPARVDVSNNLGVLLRVLGRAEESERLLQQVIEGRPDWGEGFYNLANTMVVRGKTDAAVDHFRRAIELTPGFLLSYGPYARYCYATGRIGEAAHAYEEWARLEPNNAAVQHMRAACSGSEAPDKCSATFIRMTFDHYANSFEESLDRLGYRAPAVLADALSRLAGDARTELNVIDLGCGTGLAHDELRPHAQQLTGVDMSEQMLQHARNQHSYDVLHCGDLVEYLQNSTKPYDLQVSMDTLIYFGDLDAVFAAAAGSLSPSGWFIFSLERIEPDTGTGFILQPSGRYAHGEAYIRDTLDRHGLALIELEPLSLRKELGEDVPGWLCVTKPRLGL